jgi:pimeloyl-ACP methyl ester carboxylesterase
MFMTTRNVVAALAVPLLVATAGASEPAEPVEGVVYVVGGVGGVDILATSARWALPRAGVAHELRGFAWTHGKGHILLDLRDTRNFDARAAELGTLIADQLEREPERPVYLLGHSAGAALVLRAAEKLPPASVERIILLAPAVSPHYDLRPALQATRGEIVAFTSTYDRGVLGMGTTLFGTVDRYYVPAAGLNGFHLPADLNEADRQLYQRLVQVPYRAVQMLRLEGGLHHGSTMPIFLSREITPWLSKGR